MAHRVGMLLQACLLALPLATAQAQMAAATPGQWQFALTAYAYLPQISGSASFPTASAGTDFNLSTQDILDHLKMTFMGSFDTHYGNGGFFADALYLDLGASKSAFRDFTIGNIGIPATASADTNLDMKSWVVTAAGEYRVANEPAVTLDALAGIRYLYLKQRLEWSITGAVGNIPPAAQSGTAELSDTHFDGIVGIKGQLRVSGDGRWSVPVYLDVGAGDSHLTWQGATGIAYKFGWGEFGALYRYIDFRLGSSGLKDLSIGGAMIGATFRW